MSRALLVCAMQKATDEISALLRNFSVEDIVCCENAQQARRVFAAQDFDMVLINAPLADESGERLSLDMAAEGFSQVILIVKAEFYDAVSEKVEVEGVIAISKPLNKNILWGALKLAKATQNRIRKMQKANAKLSQTIDDIRVIDRAKCLLISNFGLDENQAHKHIEKQAMDKRITKREAASSILKAYEN